MNVKRLIVPVSSVILKIHHSSFFCSTYSSRIPDQQQKKLAAQHLYLSNQTTIVFRVFHLDIKNDWLIYLQEVIASFLAQIHTFLSCGLLWIHSLRLIDSPLNKALQFPIPYVKLVSLHVEQNRDNVVMADIKVWTSPVANDSILMDRKLVSSGSSLYSPTVRGNLFIRFVCACGKHGKRGKMATIDEICGSMNGCYRREFTFEQFLLKIESCQHKRNKTDNERWWGRIMVHARPNWRSDRLYAFIKCSLAHY